MNASTLTPNFYELDQTHNPLLRSWVSSANDPQADFPIQNLPFGRFRPAVSEHWRIGVAIGDQILDLQQAADKGAWTAEVNPLLVPLAQGDLNAFMALGSQARRTLRAALSQALSEGSAQQAALGACLLPQSQAEMTVPCSIGDYTDFYTSIHHATSVGKLFRPDNPLLPNYKWVPIGYHGRASSIRASGQTLKRPQGQIKDAGPDASETPYLAPCKRLDYELELGLFIGQGNALGEAVEITQAEDHMFGLCLLNDWSARDLQAWEYQPLGPFLSKNFASTISPWLVTMDALVPYRTEFKRPTDDPQPLPYLDSVANRALGSIDMTLEVWLQTAAMCAAGEPAVRLSQTNYSKAAYWTLAQLVTHHTVNGCNLQPGDLLGSGTLSGPAPQEAGSLLELSLGGKQSFSLPNGEQRTFLLDGDTVILRGYCARAGVGRVGLGEVSGTVIAG
ncbi:MAG: fumarylacetoacetase [Burkholderiaceae bacterium]|nr:fumarylacetoacetase [Burkholderiaceae bacterium]